MSRALLILTLLAGCGPAVPPEGSIVAVGGSFLAQGAEEGLSIPDLIGAARGQQVDNRALPGATRLDRDAILGQPIGGGWDWLLVDGGGSELCGDLIDADGAVADLVGPIAASGTLVAIVGGAERPEDAACSAALDALSARYAALAAATAGVIFVDAREVTAAAGGEALLDADREAIGLYVAAAMTAAE